MLKTEALREVSINDLVAKKQNMVIKSYREEDAVRDCMIRLAVLLVKEDRLFRGIIRKFRQQYRDHTKPFSFSIAAWNETDKKRLRDIFSEELFNKYGILTSSGIQKRYLNATSRREKVELKKEYLLISIPENRKNVVINSINDGRNSINSGRNEQSRVEKSKEENKRIMCKATASALFEKLWKKYPNKKGKGQVSDAAKKRLLDIGEEEMLRAIDRYLKELEKDKDWRKPQNGSTFFNSGYVDYLDANFSPSKTQPAKVSKFHNFHERDYDFEELQKKLFST